jgi:hypothetical protein
MRPPNFDFSSTGGTLLAVFLGALLATVGGFIAAQLEAVFRRRERERAAALLFGEVLAALEYLLKAAADARGHGDPYGRLTMRLLLAARPEIDIYERNRESLYELRNAELRAKLHGLVLRLQLPLDGLFDVTQEIAAAEASARATNASEAERAEARARAAQLGETRDGSFDFLVETTAKIRPLLADLKPLARHSFDSYERAIQR